MHSHLSGKYDHIAAKFKELAPNGANFTNGTFIIRDDVPFDDIASSLLAQIEYLTNKEKNPKYYNLPLAILFNSDVGLQLIKRKDLLGRNEQKRISDVIEEVKRNFSDLQIITAVFDEETPLEIFTALNERALTKTLAKLFYGSSPDAPQIVGAPLFSSVFSFILPSKTGAEAVKPACSDITPPLAKGDSPSSNIKVVHIEWFSTSQSSTSPRPLLKAAAAPAHTSVSISAFKAESDGKYLGA